MGSGQRGSDDVFRPGRNDRQHRCADWNDADGSRVRKVSSSNSTGDTYRLATTPGCSFGANRSQPWADRFRVASKCRFWTGVNPRTTPATATSFPSGVRRWFPMDRIPMAGIAVGPAKNAASRRPSGITTAPAATTARSSWRSTARKWAAARTAVRAAGTSSP